MHFPTGHSVTATACAKAILLGEHAVVHGMPAVAVPLRNLRAVATLAPGDPENDGILVDAPDIGLCGDPRRDPRLHPLALAVKTAFATLHRPTPPLKLRVSSAIPVGKGLGSGAAVAVATVRAVASWTTSPWSPQAVSAMAFEVEKVHHGNPSGLDNTVVALEKAVRYRRGEEPQPIDIPLLRLVLADAGPAPPTAEMVDLVSRRLVAEPSESRARLDGLGALAEKGLAALKTRDLAALGAAMSGAHAHLAGLGVSTPALDRLVSAALDAGALGAKLAGAGGGGYMIALADDSRTADAVAAVLESEGGSPVIRARAGNERQSSPQEEWT